MHAAQHQFVGPCVLEKLVEKGQRRVSQSGQMQISATGTAPRKLQKAPWRVFTEQENCIQIRNTMNESKSPSLYICTEYEYQLGIWGKRVLLKCRECILVRNRVLRSFVWIKIADREKKQRGVVISERLPRFDMISAPTCSKSKKLMMQQICVNPLSPCLRAHTLLFTENKSKHQTFIYIFPFLFALCCCYILCK
jgi:hypothetical protein